MISSLERETCVASPGKPRVSEVEDYWTAGFLLLFVGGVIIQLHEEWSVNPAYSFGWGVPILGSIIFRNRWKNRPVAAPSPVPTWIPLVALALLVLWLPVRIVREANMDWRLVQWLIAAGGCAFLLGSLFWMGGRAWLGHFAFPVLFLLTAVPWPTRLENLIIQFSSGVVAHGVVQAMRWTGVAAWSAGNVIQIPGGAVGIDEACSGLRSFQGALMAALFLGELRRLTIARRVALLFLGGAAALILNFFRTLVLTLIAARDGVDSVNAWHDEMGLGTLVGAFALLWLAARLLGGKTEGASREEEKREWRFRPMPRRLVAGCLAWLVFVEGACALWFRGSGPTGAEDSWKFDPKAMGDLRREAIPTRVQSILRFDRGEAYRRSPSDGTEWWIYNIRWSEDGGGAPLARFHSPEVCLPAAGLKLVDRGPEFYPVGFERSFRSFEFTWLGKPVFLYSSYYSAARTGPARSMSEFDLNLRKRLELAWAGVRPARQTVFEVLIAGAPSASAAQAAFQDFAVHSLHRTP